MKSALKIMPVGNVRKREDKVYIEILGPYLDGLLGLKDFSHIIVLYWFDRNDTDAKRGTMRVHPMGNRKNPLTGVFATRSPVRPNPIGMSTCELVSIEKNRIRVESIDAFDGSPVIDIKPCVARLDLVTGIRVPGWAEKEMA